MIDGHTESVSIAFKNKVKPELLEIQSVLESFDCSFEKTFMTPIKPIVFRMESDRPQPRLDRDTCNGQSVTVGRLRYCNVLDIKLTLLVHNTILGVLATHDVQSIHYFIGCWFKYFEC